jgi:hypothetical protein
MEDTMGPSLKRMGSQRWLVGLAALLSISVLAPSRARAEVSPRVFALVIANNRSTRTTQPDLQYADDDGARYYQLFEAIGAAEDLALLTTFDRATREHYAPLVQRARPATRLELLSARDRLAARVREAQARGERTTFYLVFAGHGEVVQGRGLLDLEDEQIDGAFLERELLAQIAADQKHLVLDSCNSFFVVNPRKPGGRRWATPKDMAFGFSVRHPEVGLFLSTNSESDVFEWSELESGVFSHEVRSGLRGGADIDGDGAVSYLELAGFVEAANRGVARDALRPQLFYRGPHGDADAKLFFPSALRGRRVELGEREARLWFRSETGERLLDVHKESAPMSVVVPQSAGALAIFEQRSGLSERPVIQERSASAESDTLRLEALTEHAPRIAARGNRIFGELFLQPYGPDAHADYVARRSSSTEPVYGVGEAEIAHTRSYVNQFAEEGRARRLLQTTTSFAFAGVALSTTIALAVQPDRKDYRSSIGGLSALTAVLLGAGTYHATHPSSSERVRARFERELAASPQDAAHTLVRTEQALAELAAREERTRNALFWFHEALAVGYAAAGTVMLVDRDASSSPSNRAVNAAIFYSGAVTFAALGAALRMVPTPTERMMKLYRDDASLQLRLSSSVQRSGMTLGLSGRF